MTDDHTPETPAPPAPPGLATPQQQRRGVQPLRLPINPLNPNQTPSAASASGQPQAVPGQTQPASNAATGSGTPTPVQQTPGQPPTGTPPPTIPTPAGAPAGEKPDTAEDSDNNPDSDSDDKSAAPKPAFNPEQISQVITPAVSAALGVPAALLGAGMGLLAPLAAMLGLFGQGDPAMPGGDGGMPQSVLDSLGNINAGDTFTGQAGANYQSEVDDQARQANALDHLDKDLRKTLEDSAANSKLGRNKIEGIINQVKSQLQALGPISNTAAGQMGVLSAITQALTQAGAVVSQAVGKDSLNAGKVKTMSLDYLKDLNAPEGTSQDNNNLGGGVDMWLRKALAANGITDPRAIANWLPGLRTLVQRESGGNPRAFNGWDSNARKGIPSQGLFQTIPPTFAAHWRPGTAKDIFNPISNAAAGIHYIMSRYGVSAAGFDLTAKVQQADAHRPARGY